MLHCRRGRKKESCSIKDVIKTTKVGVEASRRVHEGLLPQRRDACGVDVMKEWRARVRKTNR